MNAGQILQLQAKIVVLGDRGTGKSQLIRAIRKVKVRNKLNDTTGKILADTPHEHINAAVVENVGTSDQFFEIVEISKEELATTTVPTIRDGTSTIFCAEVGVSLQFWEHTSTSNPISEQEQRLAFRGALICIIVLDITQAKTANSAFNYWLNLREELAAECFLFIVGTHLDQETRREVELKDLCKASAKKDAIYLEIGDTRSMVGGVSSPDSNTDVSLLRRLIVQRLKYMIERKDLLVQRPLGTSNQYGGDIFSQQRQKETKPCEEVVNTRTKELDNDLIYSMNGIGTVTSVFDPAENSRPWHDNTDLLPVSVLEQNSLTCNSVGSILASSLGCSEWGRGMEDDSAELIKLGKYLTHFLDQLESIADANHADRVHEIALEVGGVKSLNDSSAASSANQQIEEAFLKLDNLSNRAAIGMNNFTPPSQTVATDVGTLFRCVKADVDDQEYSQSDLQTAFSVLGLPLDYFESGHVESSTSTVMTSARADEKNLPVHQHRRDQPLISESQDNPDAAFFGFTLGGVQMGSSGFTEASRTGAHKMKPAGIVRSGNRYRRVAVQLHDGTNAEIMLDLEGNIEHQVELFLLANAVGSSSGIKESGTFHPNGTECLASNVNDIARQKLMHVARVLQRDYRISTPHSTSTVHILSASSKAPPQNRGTTANQFGRPHPIKIKFALPTNSSSSTQQHQVDLIINTGDDMMVVADKISKQYLLTSEQHRHILEQLMHVAKAKE